MSKFKLTLIHLYDKYFEYSYKPLINGNRKHTILINECLKESIKIKKLIYYFVESNSKSRLYDVKNSILYLNDILKYLVHEGEKDDKQGKRCLSINQMTNIENLLYDCLQFIDKIEKNN